jgi:hypothetical protein
MFGKLLALIGIAMIGFGIFGIVRSSQSLMGANFGNTMQLALDTKAREAQFCKSGEKLEEDKGPSEYDAVQGHYASSLTLYCVNDNGDKRDVTEEFGNSMVSQVGDIFGGVFSGLLGTAVYFVLIAFGLVFTIIGLLLASRRRAQTVAFGVPGTGGGIGYTTTTFNPQSSGGTIDLNQVIQQARDMKAASGGADLSTRLKQLEDARNAGLISQTEYERTRQQILDTLK